MRIIWFTAMSMDARLATGGQDLAFLDRIRGQGEGLAEFAGFLASVDATLLGATTLRWLLAAGHGWPHGDKPTWLLSHDPRLVERVGQTAQPFRRHAGDVAPVLEALAASGARRVWLAGGGNLAGQLLALDRIDEVQLTVAPVPLGEGPSLFGQEPLPLRTFEVAECRIVAGNAIRIRWVRDRSASGDRGDACAPPAGQGQGPM
jgi:riboflavin biosynthesis pyrimidine reductase